MLEYHFGDPLTKLQHFWQGGEIFFTQICQHSEEFCIVSGNISSYLNCLELFFLVNDLVYSQQTEINSRDILLSTMDKKTYNVLEDLCAPQKLRDRIFEGESVSNFFVQLRWLLLTCEFGIFLE